MRVFLAILLMGLTAGAGEILRHQDFEEQVPGEQPRQWRHDWGSQGDDLVIISNLAAVSGRQSMLLDRTGTNTDQWGFATPLPEIATGWLELSMAFRVEGKGDRAHFGIELRHGRQQSLALGFRFATLMAKSWVPGVADELGGSLRGCRVECYREGEWHRVRLWLPGPDQPDAIAQIQLERRTPTGYEAVGPAIRVACDVARQPHPSLRVNLSPGHRGFRVFFDDFTVTRIVGDDLGTQTGPLIGLDMYRRRLRPRHQRIVALANSFDLPVMIHSCGSSSWAFADFIEMGIQVVDTLQPEAANMAPAYLKKTYGKK